MGRIGDSFRQIHEEAVQISGNRSLQIIAVSKKHPFATLLEAYRDGIRDFGENSIQEGLSKMEEFDKNLSSEDRSGIRFHHIGPLQKGNLRKLFGKFHTTQGVGSLNAWSELCKRAAKEDSYLEYFIQLNLTGEDTKNGLTPAELEVLLTEQSVQNIANLKMGGLMTMGPSDGDPHLTRQVFRKLRELRDSWNPDWKLSMGMSGDYKIALEEGSDIIRIGSAIFGERVYE